MIHLIVHTVCDHRFNNGPLLLSDLAFLLDTQVIDWPLFWTLAGRGGHTRACVLALGLMARYWGEKSIVWPENDNQDRAALDAYLDIAAGLMLGRDFAARHDVALSCELDPKVIIGREIEIFDVQILPR